MKYLKAKLGELSRFTPPGKYRWVKLGLYGLVFLLPGGSLAVLAMSWFDHHRHAHSG